MNVDVNVDMNVDVDVNVNVGRLDVWTFSLDVQYNNCLVFCINFYSLYPLR